MRLWPQARTSPALAGLVLCAALALGGCATAPQMAALERAINEIVARHEVLRTCFPQGEREPRQEVLPATPMPLEITDLSDLPAEAQEACWQARAKQLLQRHVSAALDMDHAMYCKIERGDRRAKREQSPMIAEILQTNVDELLVLWLADQLIATVADDQAIADKALKIAQQTMKNK